MSDMGERIRALRRSLNLTQEELGEKLGIKKAAVAKYESGTVVNIKAQNIVRLAQILHTTPDYILGWNRRAEDEIVTLPILASVSAGTGAFADASADAVGFETASVPSAAGDEEYVFLRVVGDSMYPIFLEGDLVLVRCQSSVDSGSYAVVTIDNDDGVIKRIIYGKDFIELRSINPMYPPRRFEGADVTRIRVFGLVKQLKRSF